jgi:hypothetical protein
MIFNRPKRNKMKKAAKKKKAIKKKPVRPSPDEMKKKLDRMFRLWKKSP